jgi:hypothetical protein
MVVSVGLTKSLRRTPSQEYFLHIQRNLFKVYYLKPPPRSALVAFIRIPLLMFGS